MNSPFLTVREHPSLVYVITFYPYISEIVQVSTTVKRKQTTTEEKEVAPKPATLLDVYVQGTGTDMAVDSDD
jgi:hypothetical protein